MHVAAPRTPRGRAPQRRRRPSHQRHLAAAALGAVGAEAAPSPSRLPAAGAWQLRRGHTATARAATAARTHLTVDRLFHDDDLDTGTAAAMRCRRSTCRRRRRRRRRRTRVCPTRRAARGSCGSSDRRGEAGRTRASQRVQEGRHRRRMRLRRWRRWRLVGALLRVPPLAARQRLGGGRGRPAGLVAVPVVEGDGEAVGAHHRLDHLDLLADTRSRGARAIRRASPRWRA